MRKIGWFGLLAGGAAAGAAYVYRQDLTRFFRRVQQLDLNTASREEFLALPGISGQLADRIIENRPYTSPLDLVSRRVLIDDAFESLKHRFGIARQDRAA